jgi:hypothetical protein
MELENRIAALTKQTFKMAGSEGVPQPLMGRVQVIAEKSYEEFVSDQEMGQVFRFELASEVPWFFRCPDCPKKETGELSAVMKIFSLAIIPPSSDKEKINFRCR